MKSDDYILFSRDDRTFSLFRKCWVYSIESCGFPLSFFNRNFGLIKLIYALIFFLKKRKIVKIIFGTSEICLYLIFSSNKDIFVFTGLGRLLQYSDTKRNLTAFFLKTFYKGQKIIALNPQDCKFIEGVLNVRVHLINGEGYFFGNFIPQKIKFPPVKIAYVGRLLKSKGVDVLVNCFIKSGINAELYLIGDYDFKNADSLDRVWLDEVIFNSNGKIKFLGFINNVKNLLLNIDVYVSLSDREGLPFSVLDAVECGCFIVLSPVPGHLSFANFDGIHFVNSHFDLLSFFMNMPLIMSSKSWNFDRKKRLKSCEEIFGSKKISADIVKLIMPSF